MANKLKYGEETVLFAKKVPKSKLTEVKKVVDDLLKTFETQKNLLKPLTDSEWNDKIKKGEATFINWENLKEETTQAKIEIKINKAKNQKEIEVKEKDFVLTLGCGCKKEGNLYRRAKDCRLPKDQHKF